MTAPGAGEEVGEGDEISVYVSLGSQEQNQTVPLVVGMNFHEAKTLLSTRRLRIECVEEVQPQTDEDGKTIAGQVAAGTILEQSPNEDALVPAGTVINVKVMGGEGWEDPNKPRQVEISFDLPEGWTVRAREVDAKPDAGKPLALASVASVYDLYDAQVTDEQQRAIASSLEFQE